MGVTTPEGGWTSKAERFVADVVAGATLEATVVKANKIAATLRVSAQDGSDLSEVKRDDYVSFSFSFFFDNFKTN